MNRRKKMEFTESNILYCKAFRRLGDKTQMINYKNQVHFRNRMTHSLEVAAIADEISKGINCNDDIINKRLLREMCLTHDFGHTPYGHTGERKINELLSEYGYGFKHNVFSFKLLCDQFDKVPWEVLDAVLKHTKVFYKNCSDGAKQNDIYDIKDDIISIIDKNEIIKLFFAPYKNENEKYSKYINHPYALSIEGQILAISDEIAQRASDLDDAFRIIRIVKFDSDPNKENNDGSVNVDISGDPFSIKFVELCNQDYDDKDIKQFLADLKVLYNDTSKINVNFSFVVRIRDFFIKRVIENININNLKLQKYSINKMISFDKNAQQLSKDMENLFYGDSLNNIIGFHDREYVRQANEEGNSNIEKLFEIYDTMSRCIYAEDRLKEAKKGEAGRIRKLSSIKDKDVRNKCALIILEEIAKMTNKYVEDEIEKIKTKYMKNRVKKISLL